VGKRGAGKRMAGVGRGVDKMGICGEMPGDKNGGGKKAVGRGFARGFGGVFHGVINRDE